MSSSDGVGFSMNCFTNEEMSATESTEHTMAAGFSARILVRIEPQSVVP